MSDAKLPPLAATTLASPPAAAQQVLSPQGNASTAAFSPSNMAAAFASAVAAQNDGVTPPEPVFMPSSAELAQMSPEEKAAVIRKAEEERAAYEAEIRRQRHLVVLTKWRWLYRRLRAMLLLSKQRPHFSIENLSDLKCLFTDDRGRLVELDERDFVRVFLGHFGQDTYSQKQLAQWFTDIDVDAGETVSWDEFTNFMIHEAVGVETEYSRAREFLTNTHPPQAYHAHRENARHLVVNSHHGSVITSGYDGLVKMWHADSLIHMKTVNNTKNSVAYTENASGMSTGATPVVDMVLGGKGNILFVVGVDKSIHLYEAHNMNLVRRYMGRNKYSELDLSSRFVGGSRAPVDTVLLMNMADTISTMDVAVVDDREYMFCGFMNGDVGAYLAMRNSSAVEILPKFMHNTHKNGSVAKLRFITGLDALVSCGWDRSLCISSARDGRPTMRFRGGTGEMDGHTKAAFDFCYNKQTKILCSIANERDIYVWNCNVESPITKLKGHSALLVSVTFNENENQLISLSQDNTIKVWDMRNYRLFQTISHTGTYQKLTYLGFCHKRSQIYGLSSEVFCWNIRRALAGFKPDFGGHIEPIVSMEFMEEYSTVITCDPFTAMCWDVNTGRRTLVWQVEQDGGDSVSAMGLDWRKRRMLAATKSRQLLMFNHRNTQLLRDLFCGKPSSETHPDVTDRKEVGNPTSSRRSSIAQEPANQTDNVPFSVLNVANGEMSQRHTAVMTRSDIFVVRDPNPGSSEYTVAKVPARGKARFSAMCLYPVAGMVTCPSLVCGTTEGGLLIVSVTSATVLVSMVHPKVKKKSKKKQRDANLSQTLRSLDGTTTSETTFLTNTTVLDSTTDEAKLQAEASLTVETAALNDIIDQGRVKSSTTVESILFIDRKDLFATTLGTDCIFFWDLRRKNCVRFVYRTHIFPEEHIMHMTTDASNRFLFAADDQGFIYVRDISAMPENKASAIYHRSQIKLTHSFKAHNGSILQLKMINAKTLLTAGNDTLIKLFSITGDPIGVFGQPSPWWLQDSSTWNRGAMFNAELDRREIMPFEQAPEETTPPPAATLNVSKRGSQAFAATSTLGKMFFDQQRSPTASDVGSPALPSTPQALQRMSFDDTRSSFQSPVQVPDRNRPSTVVGFNEPKKECTASYKRTQRNCPTTYHMKLDPPMRRPHLWDENPISQLKEGAVPPPTPSRDENPTSDAILLQTAGYNTQQLGSVLSTLRGHSSSSSRDVISRAMSRGGTSGSMGAHRPGTQQGSILTKFLTEGHQLRYEELKYANLLDEEEQALADSSDDDTPAKFHHSKVSNREVHSINNDDVFPIGDDSDSDQSSGGDASSNHTDDDEQFAKSRLQRRKETAAKALKEGKQQSTTTPVRRRPKAKTPQPTRTVEPRHDFDQLHQHRTVTPSPNIVAKTLSRDAVATPHVRMGTQQTSRKLKSRQGIVHGSRGHGFGLFNDDEGGFSGDDKANRVTSQQQRDAENALFLSKFDKSDAELAAVDGNLMMAKPTRQRWSSYRAPDETEDEIKTKLKGNVRFHVGSAYESTAKDLVEGKLPSLIGKRRGTKTCDGSSANQHAIARLFKQQRESDVEDKRLQLSSVLQERQQEARRKLEGEREPKEFSVYEVRAKESEALGKIEKAIDGDPKDWTSRAAGLLPLTAFVAPTRSPFSHSKSKKPKDKNKNAQLR